MGGFKSFHVHPWRDDLIWLFFVFFQMGWFYFVVLQDPSDAQIESLNYDCRFLKCHSRYWWARYSPKIPWDDAYLHISQEIFRRFWGPSSAREANFIPQHIKCFSLRYRGNPGIKTWPKSSLKCMMNRSFSFLHKRAMFQFCEYGRNGRPEMGLDIKQS